MFCRQKVGAQACAAGTGWLARLRPGILLVASLWLAAGCGPASHDEVETFRFAGQRWTADAHSPEESINLNAQRRTMAYACYRKGRYREAYNLFSDWWADAPTAEAALMIGLALTRMTPDKGPASVEQATRLAPDWDQARVALAWSYCQHRDYVRAAAAAAELRRRTSSPLSLAVEEAVRQARAHDRFRSLLRLERGTILTWVGLALLAVVPLHRAWRIYRRRQSARQLERELEQLAMVAAEPIEQAGARLLYQDVYLRCSRQLREVLQTLHLNEEATRHNGLRGQIEIYRQALHALDRLELSEPRRQRVQAELEALIRRMMEKLNHPAGA